MLPSLSHGAFFALLVSGSAVALPVYQIQTIGLTDAEHTSVTTGERVSQSQSLNNAGQVAGLAYRYDGVTGRAQGQSVWLYDGATTTNIGLTDAEHTSVTTGERHSSLSALNNAGQVAGSAFRYDGVTGKFLGYSAWLYDKASTTAIGLIDAEHTSVATGERGSISQFLNNAGQVAGWAYRYDGVTGNPTGQSAWVSDGATTTNVGLTDAEHTSIIDGWRYSYAGALNNAGQVAGGAYRYDGITGRFTGFSAWLYDGATTTNIGLTDSEHTSVTTGERGSSAHDLNDAGQVAGAASRYDGVTGSFLGYSAWLYDGGTSTIIGLTDAEHTSVVTGERVSVSQFINDVGQVVGVSNRYDGVTGDFLGASAWLYDGANTNNIGLTDAKHTSVITGEQVSFAQALNNAGQVAGHARRYDGVTDDVQGLSVWLYDGAITTDIGLSDIAHTSVTSGARVSQLHALNNSGQVTGYASRFDGVTGDFLGNSAWLYDGATTYAFDLDYGSSDGRGNSYFSWLSDDEAFGVGIYERFDTLNNLLGVRAFVFDLADGFFDLVDSVAGGLAVQGWDYLNAVLGGFTPEGTSAGGHQFLAGSGARSGEPGIQAFLISAKFSAVPEPGSLALFGVGLLAAFRLLQRRTNSGPILAETKDPL